MRPDQQSRATAALCAKAPVIPVLVVPNPDHAVDLAHALIKGGLTVLEVTLRTKSALEVITKMAALPGAFVGAGTVLTADDLCRAKDAGASFAVSPGITDSLIKASIDAELPLLPGAVTASEIMAAMDAGYRMLKFFPAETSGGAAALRALGGPLPQACFCPTGGVTSENAGAYLSLGNVACVGGSWIAPPAAQESGDWAGITSRARAALHLS